MADADTEDRLKIYREFRDYIKHEDILRGNRTGWLLTSQAFLFAAQGVLLPQTGSLAACTQVIVAFMGLAVAMIASARASVQDRVFASLEEAYERGRVLPDLPNLRFGTVPFSKWKQYALSYPLVFILAWSTFLVLFAILKVSGKP